MDGVDGVALDDLSRAPVVVPPPLPIRALALADELGGGESRLERGPVAGRAEVK